MSKAASIDDIVANVRHTALVEAELAAGACGGATLPPGLVDDTIVNRRLWSVAHAAGVMAACRALRKLHAGKDECGNG